MRKNSFGFLTDESVITLAMLADAGDELDILVRVFDVEAVDPSTMAMECITFMDRIDTLFTLGECKTCGYTAYTLQELRKSKLVSHPWTRGGRSIGRPGGVHDDLFDRCLQRMRNWVTLAKATLRAEVPDFEAAYSFRIFNSNDFAMDGNQKECVDTLARSRYHTSIIIVIPRMHRYHRPPTRYTPFLFYHHSPSKRCSVSQVLQG